MLPRVAAGLALALAVLPVSGAAQETIPTRRLVLSEGGAGASVTASITGRESLDYLVNGKAGQTLTVDMETAHAALSFNVIPPDATDVADFAGGRPGHGFQGVLDLDGDWKIRVYLIRAAARRGESGTYTLNVSRTGSPDPGFAREPNDFGPREWDARGALGCARGSQPMQPAACPFKVLRYGDGATVFALAPATGEERILYYAAAEEAWSTSTGDEVDARKRGDLWSLTVADEAYEIPEAVVLGG